MTTALSVTATPGGPRSFSPKTAAGGGAKSPDQVTDLSVWAIPGALRTFAAKTPAGGGVKPSDRLTDLTVWGTPGGLRSFLAKTPADIPPEPEPATKGGGGSMQARALYQHRQRLLREDEEILAVIMAYHRTLH